MSKCGATTKAGKPCSYKAKQNGFCGKHKKFVSIEDLTNKVEKMVIVEEVEDKIEDWNNASLFIRRLLACKGGDEIADLLMESPHNR